MARRLAAYLILLGFLLGNIYRFSLVSPVIQISILDLAVIFLYIVWFLTFKNLKNSLSLVSWSLGFLLIWFFTTLIAQSLNHSISLFLTGFAYFARYCLYIFAYIPISKIFSYSQRQHLVQSLAIMFPFIGLVQYLWFPDLRPFTLFGWDMHYFRVFGTYLDPGFFGLILIWSLLYIKNIYYWLFSYLVFAYTYSRSSFLAFLTGEIFQKINFPSPDLREGIKGEVQKVMGIVSIVILVVATVFLLPRNIRSEGVRLERTASVVARAANWQESWIIFQKHPITGVGFNLLRFQYQDREGWQTSHAASGSDSSLVFVLTTSGLIGLALYLNFIWSVWIKVKLYPRLSAFFLAILIHSFFLNSQFYPPIILLFALSNSVRVGNKL